jgi:hypothetical protein
MYIQVVGEKQIDEGCRLESKVNSLSTLNYIANSTAAAVAVIQQ